MNTIETFVARILGACALCAFVYLFAAMVFLSGCGDGSESEEPEVFGPTTCERQITIEKLRCESLLSAVREECGR